MGTVMGIESIYVIFWKKGDHVLNFFNVPEQGFTENNELFVWQRTPEDTNDISTVTWLVLAVFSRKSSTP